jgi:hypothetical protein
MRGPALFALMIALLLAGTAAMAQDGDQPDPLALCEAYQVGFLQVVAVCCYQAYSSVGIVATDYANGYIDEDTARFALSENALLLGACSAGVLEVIRLTPDEDQAALSELGRLEELLGALNQLVSELDLLLDNPDAEREQAVEDARSTVEQLLEDYAAGGG